VGILGGVDVECVVMSPIWGKKERKKSLTKRACEGRRVRMGIQSYMRQGYGGVASGMRVAATRHPHLYVMDVLSGARVVRVMRVCVDSPILLGGPSMR